MTISTVPSKLNVDGSSLYMFGWSFSVYLDGANPLGNRMLRTDGTAVVIPGGVAVGGFSVTGLCVVCCLAVVCFTEGKHKMN